MQPSLYSSVVNMPRCVETFINVVHLRLTNVQTSHALLFSFFFEDKHIGADCLGLALENSGL